MADATLPGLVATLVAVGVGGALTTGSNWFLEWRKEAAEKKRRRA
jgi:hypothetical protein